MAFRRPVLPCRVILAFVSELCRKSPAQAVKLLRNLTRLPGISIPHVQIHKIQVCIRRLLLFGYRRRNRGCIRHRFVFAFSDNARPRIRIQRRIVQLVVQLQQTFVTKPASQIIRTVDGKRLIEPAPSFRPRSIDQFIVKTLCFRIRFLCIDMNARLRMVLMGNRIQLF